MSWEEIGRKIPLICCIEVKNIDSQSKENLIKCGPQFDFNVILLTNKNDKQDYLLHLQSNELQNFGIVDIENIDISAADIAYKVVLQNFKNCHCLFVGQNVNVGESIRWKIFDKISKMSSPHETLYLNESCDVTNSHNQKMVLRWACQ